MPNFNIVPEIGGVDTSDPSRLYGPDEQKAVIDGVFGDTSQDGQLFTPGGEILYIGRRGEGKKTFSIGRKESGQRSPALFIPRQEDGKLMPLLEIAGDLEYFGGTELSGILPTITRRLIGLGRHAMFEAVGGEEVPFKRSPTEPYKANRDRLADLVLRGALLDDGERDVSEDELDMLYVAMENYLGSALWKIELLEEDEHIFNWTERPYEAFCADIHRRLCEIIVR